MQTWLHSKRTFLFCLLTAAILSGCSSPTPTPTPLPTAMPVTNNLADIVNPPQAPSPCIEINVSNTAPKVGEVINVVGTLKGVLNPNYWGLEIKDQGADASSMMINLLAASPRRAADVSKVVVMTSGDRADAEAVITLQVIAEGVTEINYFVSAEDFCGTPLGQGVSQRIKITVNP